TCFSNTSGAIARDSSPAAAWSCCFRSGACRRGRCDRERAARLDRVRRSRRAPREWAGRVFDADFVKSMPHGIDPCGENGEFHTFVFEGPMLRMPVAARPGKLTEGGGFVYADLLVH